jgi:exopolysaccharide biosynthesis protein
MSTLVKIIDTVVNLTALFCFVGFCVAVYIHYAPQKQPDSFDSMLCRVHTPAAALLINDELITCTNGKKYRSTK